MRAPGGTGGHTTNAQRPAAFNDLCHQPYSCLSPCTFLPSLLQLSGKPGRAPPPPSARHAFAQGQGHRIRQRPHSQRRSPHTNATIRWPRLGKVSPSPPALSRAACKPQCAPPPPLSSSVRLPPLSRYLLSLRSLRLSSRTVACTRPPWAPGASRGGQRSADILWLSIVGRPSRLGTMWAMRKMCRNCHG